MSLQQLAGIFLSFEGIECTGKTTIIKLLMNILNCHGIKAVVRREPGGTSYGEAIRTLLKHPQQALRAIDDMMRDHGDAAESIIDVGVDVFRTYECELFLFLASRAEFFEKVVKYELQQGNVVIADRSGDSTLAYQGGGRFHSDPAMLDFIRLANAIAMRGFMPAKTILLDIAVETMRQRLAKEHPDKMAVFEKEGEEFFLRARDVYHQIAKQEPERVIVIDAERSVPEVFEEVLGHLRPVLGIN